MILVTGATGFVGRHLCALLRERGLAYRAISRHPRQGHLAIGEMSAGTDWSAALQGVTCIIHLAARVHVMQETENDPLSAFRAMNIETTLSLARQAVSSGVKRFVFVSSVKVNGERTEAGQAFHADDLPAPEDPYGVSKAEAEAALLALSKQTGMEVVIVRPPLVHGPGVGANFAALMRWAARGIPSPFGACNNSRSLVYVGNLCDLLCAVVDHPRAAGEVFLVSDGYDPSTRELFQHLSRLRDARGIQLPIPPALLRAVASVLGKSSYAERLLGNLQVDIGKTRDLLGWSPPIAFPEGLRRTVEGARSEP
ncbi:NAD-dependent epimerase/dehydratase family protein [Rhizobium oryzicola]|uniref:NAD-dependent epimerase/dehydratase family protein n=1 Tax=Rhizobium oryzicola TaxID=1232668 RepID=A0ABT8T206_9HYPH|nr:NAD-dependent epimerase/dehydratase family protein [Rhizobium oryzicola]MDO1584784.1 NAD-dependent epimerase/dehydratase family protein [Rhizobium oryzicola]